MNWPRAKTILICFFLFTNLLLLYFNIAGSITDSRLDDEIVGYSVEILQKNGITIDPGLIPEKKAQLPQFEADNIIVSYDEFAKQLLGEQVTTISEAAYSSEKGTLEFSGDNFTFTSTAPLLSVDAKKNDAINLLAGLGINLGEYDYVQTAGKIVFSNKANNLPLFNSDITIEINAENTTISGVWFYKYAENLPEGAMLKDVTTALIDLLSSPEKPQGTAKIISITPGYMMYESESYHKTLVPIPAWRIEFPDRAVYMDARAR